MNEIAHLWQQFLLETGHSPDTRYIDCDHFEVTKQGCDALLALVLNGRKCATASSARAYEVRGERMPCPGDLSIVTDWEGRPACVIETLTVTVTPFCDVTEEMAASEGEGDTLESWRRSHKAFFVADGSENGYTFDEHMPVVMETFRVVYIWRSNKDSQAFLE